MKKCLRCQLEKPLTEFYRQSRNKDGYMNECRSCYNRPGKRPGAALTNKMRYGLDYYMHSGRKGGLATKERHGTEHFIEAGAKGGSETVKRHGVDHMRTLGRKGGKAKKLNKGKQDASNTKF
jgi:uncharacterized protein